LLLLELPVQENPEVSFGGRQVLMVQEAVGGLKLGRIVLGSPAVLADPMNHTALGLAEQPVVTATDGATLNHDGTSLFRTRRHPSRLPP
jgi:hypothetical protein